MSASTRRKARSKAGGTARADRLSPEERSRIARDAALARWGRQTYRVTWHFWDGDSWSKGGYTHAQAIGVKEYPLTHGIDKVRSATMKPEEL